MKEDTIAIEVKAFGVTHTADLPEDCSAIEFIEAFSNLAESVGHAPSKVIEALRVAADARE